MRTVALVPAKAHSTGIPDKNWKLFAGGKSLMLRAMEIGAETCDAAYLTTNRPHIWALPQIRRPDELCQDDTPMIAVVRHALAHFLEYPSLGVYPEAIVLLQPTQPLRTADHVRAALRLLADTGADSVVSVVEVPRHYSPDYVLRERDGKLLPFLFQEEDEFGDLYNWPQPHEWGVTRRQDARPAFSRDGTVYAIRRQTIEAGSLYGSHCVPLIIPAHESVNLDTEEDWARAEAMVKR